MLEELRISDVGVIADVTLELGPGFNVVTGETGAGKTMVVSSLELLLGARADADVVREGAAAAVVEGRLRPPPPGADDWLGDGDDELIVSREVVAGATTRSRARLGGHLAPASALAEVAGGAIEVHGQAESARLVDSGVQRALLDRFGGATLETVRAEFRAAWDAWRAADTELSTLRASARDRARELDRLRFELAEIDAVEPVAGEEGELDMELARLEHAAALTDAARGAASAVIDDGGARDALGDAVAHLRGIEGIDPTLDALRERLEGIAAEAQDAGLELGGYAESVELDPARLEVLRDRRGTLAALGRKYGPDAAAIAAYAEDARRRVAELDVGEDRVAELDVEVERLRADRDALAEHLRAARQEAGAQLAAAVEAHLADLAMAEAQFAVDLEPIEVGPEGSERIVFQLAANPGESLLPLAKAASGGERSRVALAVRLALHDAAGADADGGGQPAVLVFDEVDAGVGGQVALAVGRKLAALARGRQVLCVTHLAQLAAFADAHFTVTKTAESGRTVAGVRRLTGEEQVDELARMLSGTGSARAAEHAAELRDLARADADP